MTKSLLIVGAGPGLGQEVAQTFGKQGFSVGLIARDADVLATCSAQLEENNIATSTSQADVTDASNLRNAIDEIIGEQGVPDVVLANTSMYYEATPTQVPLDVFETTWRVACLGTLIALQHLAPKLTERGSGAFFVPGTPLAVNPWDGAAALGAAKAATRNLTIAAAQELGPQHLHVAMLTIMGMIKEGGDFDPAVLAQEFWKLYQTPDAQWQAEVLYTGRT